jgi:hypothetical protein
MNYSSNRIFSRGKVGFLQKTNRQCHLPLSVALLRLAPAPCPAPKISRFFGIIDTFPWYNVGATGKTPQGGFKPLYGVFS